MAYQQLLPSDTELIDEFQILAHLGSGGFANTYRALEKSLGREVAIKEYFPSELAVRADNLRVEAKTESQEKQFKWGLRRFIREAQTLAKFRHPSVVRVHRVFEANDTAYIVMEFVTGSNMESWLSARGHPLTQDECDQFLPPLLDALEVVHSAGILHRDIKPANIYIRAEDSSPVLLDFGSARHAAADQAGTTAAIVSKGYSPHEAYTTDTTQQGPWSDIYGLAATIYKALAGQAPPESTRRTLEDTYASPKSLPSMSEGYRSEFLDAIDNALAVMPKQRPQSISDWRKQLFLTLPPTTISEASTQSLATTKIWKPISDDFSDTPSSASAEKWYAKWYGLLMPKTLAFKAGLAMALVGGSALLVMFIPASLTYVQGMIGNNEQSASGAPEKKSTKSAEAVNRGGPSDDTKTQKRLQLAVDSPSTLKELSGLWAPSKAGCEAILSDKPPSPSVGKHFGVIGICSNGLEMLYQPVSCSARDLGRKSDIVQIAASCRIKDYDPVPLRLRISVKDQNNISFFKEDFDPSYFTLEGAYRRCNRTYQCVTVPNIGDNSDSRDKPVSETNAKALEGPNQSEILRPPSKTVNEFFGTWVDAAQYTCRSFDESEGEWFRLSDGLLQLGYGNACKVKMTLDGPTLTAEGNECFGEEMPLDRISRKFTISQGGVIISNKIVYLRCPS